jgi:hypothetical protein
MKGHVIEHSKAIEFILGGKSLFTFMNTNSNNRFTFKVKKHKMNDIYFVSVLTNPDIYQYIGVIKDQNFSHTKKSKLSKDAQSIRVFDFVFSKLKTKNLSEFIEIWHEGKCGKCGRTLTVPSSIKTGFGPECIKMINNI